MKYSVVKRYTASGAIKDEGVAANIVGVRCIGLASDSTVTIVDSQSGAPPEQIKFKAVLQPGIIDESGLPFRLGNGGYVQIDGTAEVYLYLE